MQLNRRHLLMGRRVLNGERKAHFSTVFMPRAMAGAVYCRKMPWPTFNFPVTRQSQTLECSLLHDMLGGWGEVIGMYEDDFVWYLRELPKVAGNMQALRLWLGGSTTAPGLCCT